MLCGSGKLLCYVRGSENKEYNASQGMSDTFMDKQTQLLHTHKSNESEQSLKNDKMNLGLKAEKIQWIRCRGFIS